MSPPIHVIILNWNGTADTLSCVDSVLQQDRENVRIVVVDNGSEPDSLAPLLAPGRPFHLIRNETNLGFAGGCNVGMRHAIAEGAAYMWLLNSDALAQPGTLNALVACAARDSRIGLVTPLMRDIEPPHALMPFCGVFDPIALTYDYTSDLDTAEAWRTRHGDRLTLMGTALLVTRSLFEAIGGLDEDLFAYWEDTDYSIRANAAGFTCRVASDATIFHPVKHAYGTPGSLRPHYYYYMTRNEILLLRKHGRGVNKLKALRWRLLQQLQILERLEHDGGARTAVLAGLWDGWIGHTGAYDPTRAMPRPWRDLLARHPRMIRRLIGG
jgi:hypothetical protein